MEAGGAEEKGLRAVGRSTSTDGNGGHPWGHIAKSIPRFLRCDGDAGRPGLWNRGHEMTCFRDNVGGRGFLKQDVMEARMSETNGWVADSHDMIKVRGA